jgi:AraC family transcriptional regulator
VFRAPSITLSEFRCPPDDPRWRSENIISDGHNVVFPRTSVLITHAGREPVVTNCNHVMFYNRGQIYRRGCIDQHGDRSVYLVIGAELLLEIASPFDPAVAGRPDQPFPFDHGPSDPSSYLLHHLVSRMVLLGSALDPLLLEETILDVLHAVIGQAYRARGRSQRAPRPRAVKARAEAAQAAKSLLSRRYHEAIRLEGLAREVGVSMFHLARVFKESTGMTVHAYLNQLRLRASLERLYDRRTDLSELALDLGFSSHSHFTDAFRRAFGAPPSVVRRAAMARNLREMSKILEA